MAYLINYKSQWHLVDGIFMIHYFKIIGQTDCLTHCGLVMPYGDGELGAIRHQAMTKANVCLLSVRSWDKHFRAI